MSQQSVVDVEQRVLPVLPLRDMVLFPRMVVPLFVGRPRSIAALERAMRGDHQILLLAQREASIADPGPDDLYRVGTCCQIKQLLHMPDRNVKVLVEGGPRLRAVELHATDECLEATAEPIAGGGDDAIEVTALVREIQRVFGLYAENKKRLTPEQVAEFKRNEVPERLVDLLLQHVPLKTGDRQTLLELDSAGRRLQKLLELVNVEIEILQTEARIRNRVRENMEHTQRQYFLNEQMAAIQRELGEKDEFKSELDELAEQIKVTALSEEARQKSERELRKLKLMSPMSPEATVVRNYLDWMLGIPWGKYTEDKLDLDEAERILDEDHCGLERIKERIIEHLAVHRLVTDMKGPILCFVGPPGVGKTSLAKSIARAVGRNFVRMSLGGVRDEAEIRGHRRTYIGALPGKILQAIRRPAPATRCCCSTRWTSCRRTFMATRRRPCSRCSTPNRTTPSTTITWTSTTTCPR